MGVTAYLESYSANESDPGDGGTQLFSSKGLLPPAWFLFFDAEDFVSVRSARDGSQYTLLRRAADSASARARARLDALEPHLTPELRALLESFAAAVAASCKAPRFAALFGAKRVLVLNSHRFESTRAELTAPLAWFDEVAKKGLTRPLAKRANRILDPCDGLNLDEKRMDVGDPDALVGWPSQAQGWAPPARAKTPGPANVAAGDALMAKVWQHPNDPKIRLTVAKELTALGDIRGEFISLDCQTKWTARSEKRQMALLEDHGELIARPFRGVNQFHRGFPLEVEWCATEADPLIGHPAWSTVESVCFSGAVSALSALTSVPRLCTTPDVVRAIDRPVNFASIAMPTDKDAAAWAALASVDRFPSLVEVYIVDSDALWLPEAAQRLVHERPSLHVLTSSPSLRTPIRAPLTLEEHAARIGRWTNPPAARFLPGARYDNAWR